MELAGAANFALKNSGKTQFYPKCAGKLKQALTHKIVTFICILELLFFPKLRKNFKIFGKNFFGTFGAEKYGLTNFKNL